MCLVVHEKFWGQMQKYRQRQIIHYLYHSMVGQYLEQYLCIQMSLKIMNFETHHVFMKEKIAVLTFLEHVLVYLIFFIFATCVILIRLISSLHFVLYRSCFVK